MDSSNTSRVMEPMVLSQITLPIKIAPLTLKINDNHQIIRDSFCQKINGYPKDPQYPSKDNIKDLVDGDNGTTVQSNKLYNLVNQWDEVTNGSMQDRIVGTKQIIVSQNVPLNMTNGDYWYKDITSNMVDL